MPLSRRVTVATPTGIRPAEVVVAPDARPDHLAAAVGLAVDSLHVDGRLLAPDDPVAIEVPPGAHLHDERTADPEGTPSAPEGSPDHLVTAGGRWAARRLDLVPGRPATVGRSPHADLRIPCPTVSPLHADLTWIGPEAVLVDRNSTNGLRLAASPGDRDDRIALSGGTTVWLGAHPVRHERGAHDDGLMLPPADPRDGRCTVDRPLLDPLPPEPEPATLPEPPVRLGGRTPFSWALFLLPLLLGGALAIWMSPTMAIFALLSPVMVLGSWFENRRRQRSGQRSDQRRRRRRLAALVQAVEDQRAQEVHRLRVLHPDPAEVVRRARTPTRTLWARRPGHPAWLDLRIGCGVQRWAPRLEVGPGSQATDEVRSLLAPLSTLRDAPITLPAGRAAVLGVAGPIPVVRAAARALVVDAVTHHGPADLAVLIDHQDRAEWEWTRWLPHAVVDPHAMAGDGHLLVVTQDHQALRPGTAARTVLDDRPDRTTVVVLADGHDDLPDRCDLVVEADEVGRATLRSRRDPEPQATFLLDGLDRSTAAAVARTLARYRDPEQTRHGDLATRVHFADLDPAREPRRPGDGVGAGSTRVAERWTASDPRGLAVVLGMAVGGAFTVDLVTDGPHALVGGTTGAGKSELLRTLVAGLAAAHPPDHVTFVLVDFKGGSAFDVCADLPHTVGVITDLDGALGDRAIRSLEAEIRRRERRLRQAGVDDLADLPGQADGAPPLPRLVVVVDEFATLARAWPGVLDALVDVARRGRSLGLHLVLATQRPTGVVNEQIRTNTDLRIALRMLDRGDSTDVVGDDRATRLPADVPGRAVVRTPHGTHEVQVACGRDAVDPDLVAVRWLDEPGAAPQGPTRPGRARSELATLVAEVSAAWEDRLARQPALAAALHRPWMSPLPASLPLTIDPTVGSEAGWVLGEVDVPDEQRRAPFRWHPGEGPFLCVGMPGSGGTTTLRTVVESGVRHHGPSELHVYVLGSPAEWATVAAFPHVGAVVDPDDATRLDALLALVRATAARPADAPQVLLVVDDLRAALDAVDRSGGIVAVDEVLSLLSRPHPGLALAASVDRVSALPGPLAAATDRKLCLRLPDPYDYAVFGLGPVDPRVLPPGRGYDVASGREVQVAQARTADRRAWPPPPADARPDPLDVLPHDVTLALLDEVGRCAEPPARPAGHGPPLHRPSTAPTSSLSVPLGLLDRPRVPAALALAPGEHVLVAGPSRSGRSTTLLTAAAGVPSGVQVMVTGAARSPLRSHAATASHWRAWEDLGTLLGSVGSVPMLVLVDDADLTEDDGPVAALLARAGPVRVVAAVHHERIRARYGHWTGPLGRGRLGLALRPAASDGDLWATVLPSPPTVAWPPGRGYLIDHGMPHLVQVARP